MIGIICRIKRKLCYTFNIISIYILEYKYRFINKLLNGKIEDRIRAILNNLKPVNIQSELIRVGSFKDGGYLIPKDCFECDFLISPGIDDKVTFELAFASKNIPCVLIDSSVTTLPIYHENFEFIQKFVGKINNEKTIMLDTVIDNYDGNNGVLQMDIEGAEYEVILHSEKFDHFKYICIELHNFYNVACMQEHSAARKALEKIFEKFTCCHIHLNNTDRLIQIGCWKIPNYLELTFIRNDLLQNFEVSINPVTLPHQYDSISEPRSPEIHVPDNWIN
jgi:hypothetical protein